MKTAAKILNTIGTVLLFSSVVGYIISLAMSALFAEIAYQWTVKWLEQMQIAVPETLTAITIRASIISSSVWGLILSGTAFTLGLIATINVFLEKPGKTYHILAIVAGGICCNGLLIAGGILGLIASRHEENKAQVRVEKPQEETVVEVETEE